ncbi:hypothetical protein Btru_076541 [Bulinus truncatus]|nr:hypothetical protein Btru_076541 [Bulinus truncatus]
MMEWLMKYKESITDIPDKAHVKELETELTTEKPTTLKLYVVPLYMRHKLNKEIDRMLEMDIIEESGSPLYDHLKSLDEVFNALKEKGFTVNPRKLELACNNIRFLGHVMGRENYSQTPTMWRKY